MKRKIIFGLMFFLIGFLSACQNPTPTVPTQTQPTQTFVQTTPTQIKQTRTRPLNVIFDDDGSPDGTTALLYLLSDPSASVKAVVISHGETTPKTYIQHMGRMLEDFGIIGIPLGEGQEKALIPGEDFPEWLRQAGDNFWGFPIPNAKKSYPVQNAASMMVSLLNDAPESIAIFVSGSCTDLAQALRLDPSIRDHISTIYIMGGAVYISGNLKDFSANPENVSAEWNMYIDPLAASEVFVSGIPIVLVPLDATNQVEIARRNTSIWRGGGKIADFAADIYDMLLGNSSVSKFAIWDVMTSAIMTHPELCNTVPLHLKVITDQGNTYGQTMVMTNEVPNVQVCLEPDKLGIILNLETVFVNIK
jgi:purine nucleosidase/pyrimidine-specific ribonucleoside hydrolase